MALINAGTESYANATPAGVTVGVIASGVDTDHPDIAPNLDLALFCSSIFDDDPLAAPIEKANLDCSNKAAADRPRRRRPPGRAGARWGHRVRRGSWLPSATVGVVLAHPGDDLETTIRRADRAMFDQKRAARR